MAEELNMHFSSVFTREDTCSLLDNYTRHFVPFPISRLASSLGKRAEDRDAAWTTRPLTSSAAEKHTTR